MNTKIILPTSLMMTIALITLLGSLTPMPVAHALAKPAPEPRPDLTVLAAVYKNPNVAVRLANTGDAGAPASVLAVLLLKKIDPDTNLPVAFQFPVPALAAGQVIDRTFNIGNSSFTSNGALAVRVDFKKQVAEIDERNNQKNVQAYQAPLLPDLVIQSVEIVNDKANVYVFNKCKGPSSPAYFSVIIYKGVDKKSGWESSIGKSVPALAGGTGMKFLVDPKAFSVLTKSFSGRYVHVEVDETNEIKETVETNNWWETGAAPFPDPANSCEPK